MPAAQTTFSPGGGSWGNGLGTFLLTCGAGNPLASGSASVAIYPDPGTYYSVTFNLPISWSGQGWISVNGEFAGNIPGSWMNTSGVAVPPGPASLTYSFDRGYTAAELTGKQFVFTFTRGGGYDDQGVMTVSHFGGYISGVDASDDPGSGGQEPPDVAILRFDVITQPPYSPGQPVVLRCDGRSDGGVYFPYTNFNLAVVAGTATFPNGTTNITITNGDTGPIAETTLTIGPTFYGSIVVRCASTSGGLYGQQVTRELQVIDPNPPPVAVTIWNALAIVQF